MIKNKEKNKPNFVKDCLSILPFLNKVFESKLTILYPSIGDFKGYFDIGTKMTKYSTLIVTT